MRLRERRQMADGPRYHIAVAMQIPVAARVRAQNARDIARHRRLLGQYRNCRRTQISRTQITSVVSGLRILSADFRCSFVGVDMVATVAVFSHATRRGILVSRTRILAESVVRFKRRSSAAAVLLPRVRVSAWVNRSCSNASSACW